MPQKTSKVSDAKWAALLETAILDRERRPSGEGWKTREECSAALKIGRGRTQMMLRTWIRKGTVEVFNGAIVDENDKLCRQVWYRPK